jgi:hypothetical protein
VEFGDEFRYLNKAIVERRALVSFILYNLSVLSFIARIISTVCHHKLKVLVLIRLFLQFRASH